MLTLLFEVNVINSVDMSVLRYLDLGHIIELEMASISGTQRSTFNASSSGYYKYFQNIFSPYHLYYCFLVSLNSFNSSLQ